VVDTVSVGAARTPSAASSPIFRPAPTIGSATAGDEGDIAFTAPLSDGGSPITAYTATAIRVHSAQADQLPLITGLSNGTAYTCSVTADRKSAPACLGRQRRHYGPDMTSAPPRRAKGRSASGLTVPAFNGGCDHQLRRRAGRTTRAQ
jgi:hypothetical protein